MAGAAGEPIAAGSATEEPETGQGHAAGRRTRRARRRDPLRTGPGIPDARGPWRFLWWLIASQPRRVLTGSFWGTVWMIGLMVPPYVLARAVDDGLRAGDRGALLLWVTALLGIGVFNAVVSIMRHRTMSLVRMDASLRTIRAVSRHAVVLGSALHRRISTGELSTMQAVDVGRIAQILTMTGPGVGAVVAYAGVTVLLFTISTPLALVVVLGIPLLSLTIGPLLQTLHGRQSTYRENEGALTTLAGDIVTGLRVLTGIGGKDRFADRYRERSTALLGQGYRVGAATSWFQAISLCLPTVFLGVVTWIAARLALSGEITVGEMVAVYGYVAVLVVPVFFLIEAANDLTFGHVSLRRVTGLLAIEPPLAASGAAHPGPTGPAELVDPESGARISPDSMTALVCAAPETAAAVVERLSRHTDSDAAWGGVVLRDMDLGTLRNRLLLSDNASYLFTGSLREVVAAHRDRTDTEVTEALRVAAAADIPPAMPDGLASTVEPQARNLSGGQRQRVRLARALLSKPEVLLLVEPTSAVDAHTEAMIADRLYEARAGSTTVVVGTSPLLLVRADRVIFLVDGTVAAEGTHGHLLTERPDYRALVFRGNVEAEEKNET